MSNDKPTVATQTYNLGPWMRRRADFGWEPAEGAPHKLVEHLPLSDPVNQSGVIWADAKRTDPHRVRDGDGCEAVVLDATRRSG